MDWHKKTKEKGAVDTDAPIIFGVIVVLMLLGALYTMFLDFLKKNPTFFANFFVLF